MNLEQLSNRVNELSTRVGTFIRNENSKLSEKNVEKKGKHDFVTYVDKTSEEILVEGLEKILPGAGFITEEDTSNKSGETYRWIIDPLDGTTNFIHGITPYAISIALQRDESTVFGLVHELGHNEFFYAYENGGAFLNGKKIQVSKTNKVDNSLIATGFPYYDYTRLDDFQKTLEYFMRNSRGVRRLGSAATDLAYVACGRFDGFYEYSLSPWDVAAGAFIVQEAGGKVGDFKGENNFIFGKEIIAANTGIYKDFLEVIKKTM